MKALRKGSMIELRTPLNLSATTLEIILYTTLHRLLGLNSEVIDIVGLTSFWNENDNAIINLGHVW